MNNVHTSNLDLNLLALFAAIYRRRNLTLAGRDLNLSQSAVSHALARLRSRFGDDLFVRQGNTMQPTSMADRLAEGILPGLEMVDGVLRSHATFDPATARRTFRLGMNDYGGALLLPLLTERVRRTAPGVMLHVMNATNEERGRMLEDGSLDAVLGCYFDAGSQIRQTELLRDREACIVRRDHPLAKDPLTPERFQGMPFIALSLSVSGKNVLDMVLERTGHRLHPVVTIQQELAVPELVRTTGIAGTMAERLAQKTVHGPDLCIRPLPFAGAEFVLSLYWHISRDADPGQRWLRTCLTEAAASLPGLEQCARGTAGEE